MREPTRKPERDEPTHEEREEWIEERDMERPKMTEQINPRFIKPSMTIQQAANQADARGCTLKVSWAPATGMRVIAVPKAQS